MIMVSVICPTYNQGKYLRQGLDSVLAQQTSFSFEVLIGEDHSPDNTNELLKPYEEKYPDLIHVFHREQNLKQSKNIYDLFMRAKGKYVITLDLDDYWTDPLKLQRQVDFLESHPEYCGTAHDFTLVDAEGKPIACEDQPIKRYLNREFTLQDFQNDGFVYQTGTFCYHNIWKEQADWSILYTSDDTVVDLTINTILLLRSNVFILPDCMSAYREVINSEALNFRSVESRDLARGFKKTCAQMEKLYAYFEGKADYSRFWVDAIVSYFKGVMGYKPGKYSLREWCGMYRRSPAYIRKKVRDEIGTLVKRKLKR